MQNIAIIQQGTGRYLFSLPENVTLKEGDRVKCSTKRGITDGIAFADSAWVDENVSQLIGKLTGAKFPLKSVVGKMEYHPFEKPADKPAEDKQEPIKLYCVKDYQPGEFLTKGKVYEIAHDGANITYDDGWTTHLTITSDNFGGEKIVPNYLVPLVKRPAKVGEWVLLDRDDCFRKNKQGDVVKVVGAPSQTTTFCFIGDPTLEYSSGICACFESEYSYVLDGYHPEPEKEPEPEYFSGKVVCVESCNGDFTVGKVYEFVNGKVTDNDGIARPGRMWDKKLFKSVKEWNEACADSIARFIEFKGEAND